MGTNNSIKFFLLFLMIIINLSCNQREKRVLYADQIVTINHEDINKSTIETASNYVEDIEYIPLETNDFNLIGEISKLILSAKYIYVCDKNTNSLYQFTRKGNYIRTIGVVGNGPNEYIKISSFAVNQATQNIAIYCEFKQSIIEFNEEGIPLSEKKIGFICSDFIYYGDSYLFYGGRMPNENIFKETFPQQYRLVVIQDGAVTKEYLPFEYNEILLKTSITSDKNCLFTHDDKIKLVERCNGIVHEITTDSISAMYAVNFGNYNIPVDFYSGDININEGTIQKIEKGKYCRLSLFLETKDYIYVDYIISHYENMVSACLYSKRTKESFNIGPLWINDVENISMPNFLTIYENYFVGYYDAYELKTMLITNKNPLSEKMKNINREIDDTSNPVICIMKFKDSLDK